MNDRQKLSFSLALGILWAIALLGSSGIATEPRAMVGAYYFDGWAGESDRWRDDPKWLELRPPTHLTKRLLEEFSDREPIWGWRDDSQEAVELQIDLAADHGIAFFAFCWYWNSDPEKVARDPKHTGLELFLKARNNYRMGFCLLVANHQGFLFRDADEWAKAGELWLRYFEHPQYVTVGGRPLLIIFNPANGDREGFERIQAMARKEGFPGVAIAACGGGAREMGFTHATHYNIIPGYAGTSEARPYEELIQAHERAWRGTREQPYLLALSVGWDKRPWEGPRGLGQPPGSYYVGRTPERFAAALKSALAWMDAHPEETAAERIVMIYAWNEFGEGGYLAPTKGDPEGAYLKALKTTIQPEKTGSEKAKRILFLGNSITLHAPSKEIGWRGNWGMAASSREKDYVHVLADALAEVWGTRPKVRMESIVDFERGFDSYDVEALLRRHKRFEPDLVILAIGENVPPLGSKEARSRFQAALLRLLGGLKQLGNPDLFVRSCFWPNPEKDEILRESCAAAGGRFVEIGHLSSDESNCARSERSFAHPGVAAHPGDKGMRKIARELLKAISPASVPKAEQ